MGQSATRFCRFSVARCCAAPTCSRNSRLFIQLRLHHNFRIAVTTCDGNAHKVVSASVIANQHGTSFSSGSERRQLPASSASSTLVVTFPRLVLVLHQQQILAVTMSRARHEHASPRHRTSAGNVAEKRQAATSVLCHSKRRHNIVLDSERKRRRCIQRIGVSPKPHSAIDPFAVW